MSRPQASTEDDAHALIERRDARGNAGAGKAARAHEAEGALEGGATPAELQSKGDAGEGICHWRVIMLLLVKLMVLAALGVAVTVHLYFKVSRRER